MIDHAKLARLALELDLKRASARAVSDLYYAAAEQASRHAAEIAGSPFLSMSAAELDVVQIDAALARSIYGIAESDRRKQRDIARSYRAAKDRADELKRRVAVLQDELAPLAVLCDRLAAYALKGA